MAAWLVAAPDQKSLMLLSPLDILLFWLAYSLFCLDWFMYAPSILILILIPSIQSSSFLLPPSPHNQMGNEPKPQQQEKATEEARGPHKIAAGEGWIFCT
jgi:hypothetical protein